MSLNPAALARVQFAFTVSFHIIFPTMSIGLAMFLAVIEGLWLRTKNALYLQIYRFWLSVFAMGFGVGVVPVSFSPLNLAWALHGLLSLPGRRSGQ
jgi:cytochrome d ubiquinol oxidase subunit I